MGFAGLLTSDVIFGVIGVLIGLATWMTNRHYRRKAYRLDAERQRKEMEVLALEEEYKRRADARDEREFQLRMRKEHGRDWGDL